jgi:hypothetical protein
LRNTKRCCNDSWLGCTNSLAACCLACQAPASTAAAALLLVLMALIAVSIMLHVVSLASLPAHLLLWSQR